MAPLVHPPRIPRQEVDVLVTRAGPQSDCCQTRHALGSADRDRPKRQGRPSGNYQDRQATHLAFCTHGERPLGQRYVLRVFKPLLAPANMRDVPHDTLATPALRCGSPKNVPGKVVQERLGHATLAMPLDNYSHLIPSMRRAAVDQLDTLLA